MMNTTTPGGNASCPGLAFVKVSFFPQACPPPSLQSSSTVYLGYGMSKRWCIKNKLAHWQFAASDDEDEDEDDEDDEEEDDDDDESEDEDKATKKKGKMDKKQWW